MIDILSGGRVVCGFVRGLGQESIATNINPIYNRERFDEAHNVIIKAWTTPGPFRWEGRHFEYRMVNPWMRPLQKPHPPDLDPRRGQPRVGAGGPPSTSTRTWRSPRRSTSSTRSTISTTRWRRSAGSHRRRSSADTSSG